MDKSRTLLNLISKDLFVLFINLNHTYKRRNKRITFIPSLPFIMKNIVTLIIITLFICGFCYGQDEYIYSKPKNIGDGGNGVTPY